MLLTLMCAITAVATFPAGSAHLAEVQDIRAGGKQGSAQYQYTLQSDNVDDLYTWTPRLVDALEHSSILADVSSDQEQRGLETYLDIDRNTTARLGLTPQQIDNTLYDAFGQRQVSVIYSAINQYHVVMGIDPRYTQYPNSLRDVYVATSGGTPAGTAVSNAPAGTTAPPANAAAATKAQSGPATSSASGERRCAGNSARNVFTNALANTGKGSVSAGAAVSTTVETMIPLAVVSH